MAARLLPVAMPVSIRPLLSGPWPAVLLDGMDHPAVPGLAGLVPLVARDERDHLGGHAVVESVPGGARQTPERLGGLGRPDGMEERGTRHAAGLHRERTDGPPLGETSCHLTMNSRLGSSGGIS